MGKSCRGTYVGKGEMSQLLLSEKSQVGLSLQSTATA